jgi:hypothetical protein
MFCWPCITVYQYSETNVMHFLFSLLRIKGLYMFPALLAHPQEVLHKRHLVYCVHVMSVIIFSGSAAQRGLWPPRSWGFLITHNDAPQSVGHSFGRVISQSQRPLPDNTQHSQQTNIHDPGGIQTHDRSRRAAVDLRIRPRGHWDRPCYVSCRIKSVSRWFHYTDPLHSTL